MKYLEKEKLRNKIKNKRKTLSANFAKEASNKICNHLKEMILEKSSKICAFYPCYGEPDIISFLDSFLNSGGKVYLPKWSKENNTYQMLSVDDFGKSLKPGRFGIPEPLRGELLSDYNGKILWLVPGVVFSHSGKRIGYGTGSYDKLLTLSSAPKIGIAYEFQILDDLPVEEHDISMDYLITEKKIYKCKQKEIIYE